MPAASDLPLPRPTRGRPPTPGLRETIVRAAEQVFTRRDYHEVQMDDVAAACGVGKGTLYRYFASKRELYLAVTFEGIGRLRDEIEAAVRTNEPPARKIEHIVRRTLGFFWDRRGFFALMHQHELKPDTDVRDWLTRRAGLTRLVEDALRQAIAVGELRRIDPRLATEMLFGMMRGVNRYRTREDALEPCVEAVVDVFMRGIATQAGRQTLAPRKTARRPMRSLIVAALVVLAGVARGATLSRKSLDECIAIAIAQQPTLKASDASIEAARERVWQSAAAYLPQVTASYAANRRAATTSSLTGGGFQNGAQRGTRTFNFYSTGVGLNQVLFDFGQNLALIHRQQALARSSVADAETQRDQVVFDVSQSYLALLADYRLREVADETVRQNQQHLDLAEGRYEVGFAPRFDVTQAQVQLATAELGQVTAHNNVTLGRETLRNAMGLSQPLDFDIVDVLDEPAVTLDEQKALDLAYGHRPELVSIAAQREAAAHQIRALQTDYLPKIGGTAAYNWTGSQYPLQDTWNIGASVNLSVFNGGLTTAQIGEARANLAALDANEETIRQSVTLEVQQALVNVRQGVESIRVADKGLRQAQENLELAEGRYSTGAGSIIELTDAQASLASAKANRIQALVTSRTAVAALERATAYPVE